MADSGAECRAVDSQGADRGHFVANISFGPAAVAAIRPHIKAVMDMPLMVAPVDPCIPAFLKAGRGHVAVSGPDPQALSRIRKVTWVSP